MGLIPGSGRSPGKGNSNPLEYSCLESPRGQRNLVGCSPWGHMTEGTWVLNACFPTSSVSASQLLCILTTTWCHFFFNQFDKIVDRVLCGFLIYIFLMESQSWIWLSRHTQTRKMAYYVEHLFMCLLVMCISSSDKIAVQNLCLLQNQIIYFPFAELIFSFDAHIL